LTNQIDSHSFMTNCTIMINLQYDDNLVADKGY